MSFMRSQTRRMALVIATLLTSDALVHMALDHSIGQIYQGSAQSIGIGMRQATIVQEDMGEEVTISPRRSRVRTGV